MEVLEKPGEGNLSKETPTTGLAFKCPLPTSEQPNVNFYDTKTNVN